MTCKDCLHYEVCKDDLPDSELNKEMTEDCHCCYFKDKSKFIELPNDIEDVSRFVRDLCKAELKTKKTLLSYCTRDNFK